MLPRQRSAVGVDVRIKRRSKPLGERLDRRQLHTGWRDDSKFVTAKPRQERAMGYCRKTATHLTQQGIAERVSKHVVDGLEPIQIHAQQGKTFARSGGETDCRGNTIIKCGAVGQVRQRVVTGHMLNALFVLFLLGEVVDHADEVLRLSLGLHRQPRRRDNARAIGWRCDRVFAEEGDFSRFNQLLVFGFDLFRTGLRHDFAAGLAQHDGAAAALIFFGGTIDQQLPQIRDALHNDRRRHMLDDRVEK